jgi:hypothetical protein
MGVVSTAPSNMQTCRHCGRSLSDPKPLILLGRTFVLGPTVCGACDEAKPKPAEQSEWERICPEEYQRTDVPRLEENLRRRNYDVSWLRQVLAWQYGPKGLLVGGSTGVGKTRAIWVLLRRVEEVWQVLAQTNRRNAFTARRGLKQGVLVNREVVGLILP